MKAEHPMAPAVAMPSGNPLAIPTVAAVAPRVAAATGLVGLVRTAAQARRNGATSRLYAARIAWEAPS